MVIRDANMDMAILTVEAMVAVRVCKVCNC